MDRSIRRLPTSALRVSITLRWASITISRAPSMPAVDRSAVDRSAVPAIRRPALPARRPVTTGDRRWARPATRRRLAVAAVLVAAIVLFATVPSLVARLTLDSGIWDLPRSFANGIPKPDLSPHVLPLLLGSIVVLAVVTPSGGHHHHHDHW